MTLEWQFIFLKNEIIQKETWNKVFPNQIFLSHIYYLDCYIVIILFKFLFLQLSICSKEISDH